MNTGESNGFKEITSSTLSSSPTVVAFADKVGDLRAGQSG